jgi:hypothetical protein
VSSVGGLADTRALRGGRGMCRVVLSIVEQSAGRLFGMSVRRSRMRSLLQTDGESDGVLEAVSNN